MNINRLPKRLSHWLEARGFGYTKEWYVELYGDQAENVVYSAACECLEDCESLGNSNNPYIEHGNPEPWERCYGDFKAALREVATVRNFVKRESKTHKKLPLDDWYDHEWIRDNKQKR